MKNNNLFRFSKLALAFAACASLLVACDGGGKDQRVAVVVPKTQSPVYYVMVTLRDSHFSLDPFKHIADHYNAQTIPLPVSFARFQSIQSGQKLVSEFRTASAILNGSWGHTQMIAESKPTVLDSADRTSCPVTLELSQSNLTIDPFKHLKNASNAATFAWDMPCSVANQLSPGHDFAAEGFRHGSLFLRGSLGEWHLRVTRVTRQAPQVQ